MDAEFGELELRLTSANDRMEIVVPFPERYPTIFLGGFGKRENGRGVR
jgi:hypothetical protein